MSNAHDQFDPSIAYLQFASINGRNQFLSKLYAKDQMLKLRLLYSSDGGCWLLVESVGILVKLFAVPMTAFVIRLQFMTIDIAIHIHTFEHCAGRQTVNQPNSYFYIIFTTGRYGATPAANRNVRRPIYA